MPTTLSAHINTSSKNANPRWKRLAYLIVKRLARRLQTFTTADVQGRLARYDTITTHDLRAMGGVMIEARKAGIVESAGLVRRNDRHTRAATTLWKSLIYKERPKTEKAGALPVPETPKPTPPLPAAVTIDPMPVIIRRRQQKLSC